MEKKSENKLETLKEYLLLEEELHKNSIRMQPLRRRLAVLKKQLPLDSLPFSINPRNEDDVQTYGLPGKLYIKRIYRKEYISKKYIKDKLISSFSVLFPKHSAKDIKDFATTITNSIWSERRQRIVERLTRERYVDSDEEEDEEDDDEKNQEEENQDNKNISLEIDPENNTKRINDINETTELPSDTSKRMKI